MLVLAAVVVVFALAAAVLAGFLFWSAHEIDQSASERQRVRIAQAVKLQLDALPRDQESAAVWDDAVVAARDRDMDWLAFNIGSWTYTYFGHDESYVISADDEVVYVAHEGVTVRQMDRSFETRRDLIEPIVAEVRRVAASGYLDTPPHIADYALIDGLPVIISAIPIVSDTGNIGQRPGREAVLISVVRLEIDYELRMMQRYMTEVGRFTTNPAAGADLSVMPIANRAGRIIAFFEWIPYRPGAELLGRTGPALAVTFAVVALLLAALASRLRRALNALEHRRIEAERQAGHDPLTGLLNRLSFDRLFDARLSTQTPRDAPLALLMLDLDRFKQVNDTLGHSAGDDLICAVADRLRDVTEPGDVLARLGGDEFAILHSSFAGQVEVTALAHRIIEAIGRPFRIQGSEAFVGVSIGIVIAGAEIDSHELSRKADIALYEAKSAGRNRSAVYREAMGEVVQSRHSVEADLREALRVPGQLWVAYQPLCDSVGNIIGAEALMRWTNPRLGDIPPARFIGVAESSGLIEQLGEFVLRRAAQFGARWPGRNIAVNISPAQLRNPTFPDRVFAILGEAGMHPADLEMEITESILIEDETVVAAAIRTFREAGIRIALDDFGTGYSSLNYLKRYPVDRIKIDRSFVSQLMTSNGTDAIVQALVTLARALDIEVTAEGVETREQYEALLAMGCDTFQGYLFSAPLTVGDIEVRLREASQATSRVA